MLLDYVEFAVKDVATMSIALLGAVLGVINTWNSINQRRVQIRVTPKIAQFVMGGEFGQEMACIEVINLSSFPISVREVGFTLNGDPRKHNRVAVLEPETSDRMPFARRLEPRQVVAAYFSLDRITPDIKRAYVLIDCGEVAYGVSPALQRIRKLVR